MKKLLKERFQQLAGIKPLYETTPREVGEDQIALAAFLQKHKGEVEKAVNGGIPKEYHNKLTDFAMDDLGDVSAETYDDDPTYPTGGLSFRHAKDVDDTFVGEEGEPSTPITIAGAWINYISYNI